MNGRDPGAQNSSPDNRRSAELQLCAKGPDANAELRQGRIPVCSARRVRAALVVRGRGL